MTRHALLVLVAAAILADAAVLRAQYVVSTLVAPDAATNDNDGGDVDVRGDLAIVGASGATYEQSWPLISQGGAGSAYIYRKASGAWTLEAQIWADDFEAIDYFASGVGVDGTCAALGALGDDNQLSTNVGSLYVFRWSPSGWTEEAKLMATPPAPEAEQLGASVAVEGDVIAGGAPYYQQPLGVIGAVYVFEFGATGWTQKARLLNTNPMHAERLGTAVALSGSSILAGAPGWGCNGPPGTCTGAAFVFRKVSGTWKQEAMLSAPDGAYSDHFGMDVDIEGDLAVVGAVDADRQGIDSGAAYVFRRSGTSWTLEAELLPCDGHAGAGFGASVAVSGESIVVGAPHDPEGGGGGATYVFRHDNGAWLEVDKVLPTGASSDAAAGSAVAVDGGTALIGASLDDASAQDAGRAWIVEDVSSEPTWGSLSGGLAGVSGVPVLQGTGSLLAGTSLSVSLSGAAPSAASTLVAGFGLLCAPFKGGLLVPAPDVLLAGLVTDAGGAWILDGAWPAGVPSGLDLALQVFTVDAAAAHGLSASGALGMHAP